MTCKICSKPLGDNFVRVAVELDGQPKREEVICKACAADQVNATYFLLEHRN